ncbi:hypothetical protein F5146DRAFT_133089 [Armillaria mellea]|nr:hypothetical protein F5146DRAFT_133089 [Armillaria mellea]
MHISSLLLTHLLLPVMEVSPLTRIIRVTRDEAVVPGLLPVKQNLSVGALCVPQYKVEEEQHITYFTSKSFNMMCCAELARRTEVKVAVAHPGLVTTELARKDINGENFQPVDLEAG